jgi:uncharacterized membrane protein
MTSHQNPSHTHNADHAVHADHGSTPAAWTAVVIITVAFIVGTLAVVWANWVLFWIAAGMVVLGGVVGKVMSMMGFGKKSQ